MSLYPCYKRCTVLALSIVTSSPAIEYDQTIKTSSWWVLALQKVVLSQRELLKHVVLSMKPIALRERRLIFKEPV